MKKISFLTKLFKKDVLEIVEPSEEIKESYIKKSENSMISAKILLKNEQLENSIALSYYGMYNMLTALLFKSGIKCENHNGSIMILKEIFDFDNQDIFNAKKERVDKQYYTDFHITREDVIEAIKNAEIFNNKLLDFISRVNNKDIQNYRTKLKEII